MIKITDIITKPSEAIQAMIDGLEASKKWKNFELNMGTFGEAGKSMDLCFGCAATCTVFNMVGKIPVVGAIEQTKIRSKFLNIDYDDLNTFESAIDDVRRGDFRELFEYFGIHYKYARMFSTRITLFEDTWEENIHHFKASIIKLKEEGY